MRRPSGKSRKNKGVVAPGALLFTLEPVEPRTLLSAEIHGRTWNDLNADGVRTPNEPVLSNITLFLDTNHNNKPDPGEPTTLSKSDGTYAFTNLPAGNYLVGQIPKTGYTRTSPNISAPAPAPAIIDDSPTNPGWSGTHQLSKRSIPNDPLFSQQWSLRNTGQSGGIAGQDADVTSVWDNYTGAGVVVGIVDDGLQRTHPDLATNYDAADSYDFWSNDTNPSPGNGDDHGTAVAGIVGARGNNGVGISGVAPQVSLAGIRAIVDTTTDTQESNALSYHRNAISIYNNSWGPDDDGKTLQAPGPLTQAALRDGATLGRNGKGNIFVWAAGNGGEYEDNVNYDGYANSRYVIAATAITDSGTEASYAEPGAPILVSAYSDGGHSAITTTDRTGTNGYSSTDYTTAFGGTSASAPMVSGVVALMLQANPSLTWRDVKEILVNTSRKNDPTDPGWIQNGAGHWVNDKYGFGAIDAAAAVNAALTWTNLPAETSATSGTLTINQAIPDNNTTGLSSSYNFNNLMRVETAEVVFNAAHTYRGDLHVTLISPDGTQSVLADVHSDSGDNYTNWTFTSTHHYDEIAKGTWTLKVTDERGQDIGTWIDWKLNLYGTPITGEHYVTVAANTVLNNLDFGSRPLPGAQVVLAAFTFDAGPNQIIFNLDKAPASNVNPGDLQLTNTTTGHVYTPAELNFTYSAAARQAVWSFSGGLLPDGNYIARLKAENITLANGAMLDGNSDGVGGDDYVFNFFQLKGDANRDRIVDTNDYRILKQNFGQQNATWSQGDFNLDGVVNFVDFQSLELAFNHALPAPAPTAAFTSVEQLATASKPTKPAKPAPISKPTFSTKPILRKPQSG